MQSKYVKDYEGLYEVTGDGKVYSIPRTVIGNDGKNYTFKGRYLAPQLNKVTGYLTYSLWKNNKQNLDFSIEHQSNNNYSITQNKY